MSINNYSLISWGDLLDVIRAYFFSEKHCQRIESVSGKRKTWFNISEQIGNSHTKKVNMLTLSKKKKNTLKWIQTNNKSEKGNCC